MSCFLSGKRLNSVVTLLLVSKDGCFENKWEKWRKVLITDELVNDFVWQTIF